jgi:hypothetical protein
MTIPDCARRVARDEGREGGPAGGSGGLARIRRRVRPQRRHGPAGPCRHSRRYLSWLADSGRKSSTIGRRAAAIGYHHKMAGHEQPTNKRGEGGPARHPPHHRRGQAGQGTGHSRRSNQHAGTLPRHTDRQARPRAAGLGFAGAFRRSELVALQVEDLVETPDGLRVLIRHSKTDQEGQGAEVRLPPATGGGGAGVAGSIGHHRRVGVQARAEGWASRRRYAADRRPSLAGS